MTKFDAFQSWQSSWVVGVMIVAGTIIWRQVRLLINEWRLYKRKQKYPHMVIYKPTPIKRSPARPVRNPLEVVDCLRISTMRVMRWTLSSFLSVRDSILSVAYTISIRAAKKGSDKDPTTPSIDTQSAMHQNHVRYESFSHQISFQRGDEGGISESSPEESYVGLRRRSSVMFASPTVQFDHPLAKEDHQLQVQKPDLGVRPFPDSTSQAIAIDLQRSDHSLHWPVAAMTLTKHAPIDFTPLSEQIRKRRSNMEDLSLGRSVKKRRLNDARITLKGCAVRPRASWQYRPSLKQREREEREERILKDMASKRSKPTIVHGLSKESGGARAGAPPSCQFGETSKATPGSAAEAPFVFGQGNQDSTLFTAPLPSQPTLLPPPAFQFASVDSSYSASSSKDPSTSISQADNQNLAVPQATPVQIALHGNAPDDDSSQRQGEPSLLSVSAEQQRGQSFIFGSTTDNGKKLPALPFFPTPAINGANDVNNGADGTNLANSRPPGLNGSNKPSFDAAAPPLPMDPAFLQMASATMQSSASGATTTWGMNGLNGTKGTQPNSQGLNGSYKPLFGSATQPSSGFDTSNPSTMQSFALGTNGGSGPKFGLPQNEQPGTAGARRRAAKVRGRKR